MQPSSNFVAGNTVYSLCDIDSKLSVIYMRIVAERPPNYAAIVDRFPFVATHGGVLFCWGDRIYNPDRVAIPDSILAHEQVHSLRQADDPEAWWAKYLASDEFRLNEELPAHIVEYRWFRDRIKNRNRLAGHLADIAGRLSSPLYGGVIGYGEAMRRIRLGQLIDQPRNIS